MGLRKLHLASLFSTQFFVMLMNQFGRERGNTGNGIHSFGDRVEVVFKGPRKLWTWDYTKKMIRTYPLTRMFNL